MEEYAQHPAYAFAAGVEAARVLARQSTGVFGGEEVGALAGDIGSQLEALEGSIDGDVLVEAALICADLANLAACSGAKPAAHLAAGAAQSLRSAVVAAAGELGEPHRQNLLRDARNAGWRAGLVSSQVEP
jgi:hypothetical protein